MKKAIKICKEKFAILKAKRPVKAAFANISYEKEVTVIIDFAKIKNKKNIIKIKEGYRIITFDMNLPFNLVGFIAKISKALAGEKIPVFIISSYSTDHILLKQKYLKKAVNKLKSLGFEVK